VRGKVVAALLAATLGTTAVGAGAFALTRSAQALPGTRVAGTDVSGLSRSDLGQVVERLASTRTTGDLPLIADGEPAGLPRLLVSVDVDETVDRALAAGRTGPLAQVLGPLLGALGGDTGRPVELSVEVDDSAVRARLEEIAERLDRASDPGGIEVRGSTVTGRPPRPGRSLDRAGSADLVSVALQEGRQDPVELPVDEVAPPTTPGDVERVVVQARRALAGPYSLTGDGHELQVTPREIGPLLRTPLVGDGLTLQVDLPGLNALVAEKAEAIERPAREAGFQVAEPPPVVDAQGDLTWTPQPASVSVTPSATGLGVDVDAATERLSELIVVGQRDLNPELLLSVLEPELSTPQAEAAGVRTLLGTFTTYFEAGQPRAKNIRRIAQIVDGSYVPPGETFSLNHEAGRRTLARGFVADGAIVAGELIDEVGGGVSQFATTLFNAAFFAGLPIPEHQPHSFYINRYPAGRESTVYFGAIDVKVHNDTGHGLLVETSSTPGSVTVALYGDNGGRQVTASHGPRQPREDGGFRISVTRTIRGGEGVGGTRVFRTSYRPSPEG
jgi:vancomycin resistance protein YoaR